VEDNERLSMIRLSTPFNILRRNIKQFIFSRLKGQIQGLIAGLVKLLENGDAEDFNNLRKEFNQQSIR